MTEINENSLWIYSLAHATVVVSVLYYFAIGLQYSVLKLLFLMLVHGGMAAYLGFQAKSLVKLESKRPHLLKEVWKEHSHA